MVISNNWLRYMLYEYMTTQWSKKINKKVIHLQKKVDKV